MLTILSSISLSVFNKNDTINHTLDKRPALNKVYYIVKYALSPQTITRLNPLTVGQ